MPDSSSQSRYRAVSRLRTENQRSNLSITLFIYPTSSIRVIESRFVSDLVNPGSADPGDSATADTPRDTVPAAARCIWPGCTRSRARGWVSGSGRQKEYCLQADPPEDGGGPVHNARNRWAALRSGGDGRGAGNARRAGFDGGAAGGQGGD